MTGKGTGFNSALRVLKQALCERDSVRHEGGRRGCLLARLSCVWADETKGVVCVLHVKRQPCCCIMRCVGRRRSQRFERSQVATVRVVFRRGHPRPLLILVRENRLLSGASRIRVYPKIRNGVAMLPTHDHQPRRFFSSHCCAVCMTFSMVNGCISAAVGAISSCRAKYLTELDTFTRPDFRN